MDDPTDIIKNFEEILNRNANKEPIAIYKDQNSKNIASFQGKTSHSVQDVLSKVSNQIKAIQKADVLNSSRQDRKKLDKFKKSAFIPVNMLPRDVEVPTKVPATKFETQLVSDTQLIHIIDNAEALADNNGITQEFDSRFSQTDIEKVASADKNCIVCKENKNKFENDSPGVINKDTKFNNADIATYDVTIKENKSNDQKTTTVTIETIGNLNINTKCDEASSNNDVTQQNLQLNDNCTELFNKCIEIETNLNVLETEELEDDEIQPSLVFKARKSKTPSPLVFDLGTFEDFEKIAVPIIEESTDLKSAKQLINSQIIGKELFIQTNLPPEVSETKEQLSPVLKISAERLKITKTEYTNSDLKTYKIKEHIPVEVKENDGTFLKDEILFSSDEEIEYLHKEFQDIPLTCALETSFYEQPDMLDKTMYVGFQTASNRSIQISTESFSKAKSILDDVEKVVSSKVTLTDLVESLSFKHNTANLSQSNMNSKTTGIILKIEETDNASLLQKEIYHLKRPDKRKFEGFVTASKKKIKLSDMALARCKKVFQDIDLEDNFEMKNETEVKCLKSELFKDNIKVGSRFDNSDENEDIKLEMNPQIDDDILREFANDMSLINDEKQEFETASNKDIQILEADRATSQKFFDGIDFSDSILEDIVKDDISKKKASLQTNDNINKCGSLEAKSNLNLEFIGFKTASNNQIKISSKAFEKAENLFHEIHFQEDEEVSGLRAADSKINQKSANQVISSTSKGFGGFKTASHKNIQVSYEAMVRSKSILQDIISNASKDDPINEPTNEEQSHGFKTANNKEIKISKDTYLKTKDIFKDIQVKNDSKIIEEISKKQSNNDLEQAKEFEDDLNEVFNSELLDIDNEHISDLCLFKTAKDKPVNFLERVLSHNKNEFNDFEVDDSEENNEIVPAMLKKSKSDFVMMSSHPDKVFYLRNTSKTPPITKNTAKEIDSNLQVTDSNINVSFMGFQTASRKPIDISDEALAKSKEIFRDIDSERDVAIPLKNNVKVTKQIAQFKGFRTSDNKPIAISAKTLASSKEMFKDIDDISNNDFNGKESSEIQAFKGFQNANNKPIKVSSEVLAKSKALFEDIDNDAKINKLQNEEPKFVGFQTASKKPVEISANALAKSKALFKDINDGEHDILENSSPNKDNTCTFKGFQTASKKAVKISAEALARSKVIFQDIDNELIITEKENVTSKYNISKFEGFQTASKNPVQISADALAKSKALFKDIDNLKNINSGFELGFQTASKKPVKVSEEALAKSKALFEDINLVDIVKKDIVTSNNDVPKFIGFQTASKKPVQVSEAASAKSKALFEDITLVDIIEKDSVTSKDDVPKFIGFQTASKKPVQVSKEALGKSKALFEDINLVDIAEKDSGTSKDDVPKFKGFQTASKKPVQVSKEALAKSKALFEDINLVDIAEKDSVTSKDDVPKFKGFQTASKKPVQVSKEALAKSKALFEDINLVDIVEKENVTSKANVPKFLGFETASKKPVQVSEAALAKSKALFKEFDNETDLVQNSTYFSQFLGFQTANNKSVKVSEEALAKSKRVFEDIDAADNKIDQFENSEMKNKKVKISKQTLTNSQQIFHDINLRDDCKENLKHTANAIKTLQFKTGNNKIEISENALKKAKQPLKDSPNPKNKNKTESDIRVYKEDNNIEKLIDTQVLNNFEHTLYTEDFSKETPIKSKRSGSPILSCPRAKKRKFNTPYRNDGKIPITNAKIIQKHDDIIFNNDYKKNKRYTLKELAKVEETDDKLNPDAYILNFNMDNLLDFKFTGLRNEVNDGIFSIEDLKEYFLRIVNKKLIPNGWLDIQLKLILWKLISYEVKFTRTLNRVCTAKNVVEQLKYRYEKELYNVERPVLRKILEKDDVPSKTMVLCVADVFMDGVKVSSVTNITSNVELLLTDGWYCVKAVIDKMLTKLVYDEKIKIGSKVVTNGAELLNCEQGLAPWEDTSSVRLKIFGNSTRRARWDARLGCHGNAAILTQLSSVKPEGGKVSKLRLYVTRVYPMLYVEKFEDGSTVTRSERLENIHQIKYEAERQNAMEKLYEEVEKELSDQESQDSTGSQFKNRRHCESMITESQTKSLEEKSNRQREKLLQNIQERVRKKIEEQGLNVGRNVVSLLKIRVAGVEEGGSGVVVTKGFMSIWKPNDMLTEVIKENSWIEVMNVVPTAIRYSEIHLSAGRQTVFNKSNIKEKETIKPHLKTLVRKYYSVGDLAQNPTMTTDYNEIDTVGFIFQIDEESSKQPFQNIYLSDGERSIICVNFWGGLRKFGFQNILDTGQIVSCTNLQKRAGNTRKSIPQFRVTEFTYFTKTPKNLTARNMIVDIEKKVNELDKKKYCEECIKLKNNYSNKCFTENVSPYRFSDLNLTKNKVFIDSPLIAKREDNLNLTGLDFESTFRQIDTQELSPKSKERKNKVNEKIARLKMIGEPPPLSPMNIINQSKNAFNSYKSPLALTSVASANNSTENSRNNNQSSPIIQINRTYVKNVNPVKLNFSNVQDNSLDEVDHFAEEFDGSPPLSLE